MKRTGIIAFCGSKGSGKSTTAEVFKELFKAPVEDLAIAGHLKLATSRVFDIEMKHFLEPELKEVEFDKYPVMTRQKIEALLLEFGAGEYSKEYDKYVRPHVGQVFDTPRRLLQYVGSELLHPIDPQIHVKNLCRLKDKNKLTLVTDMRFLSEFNYLTEQFGQDFVPVFVHNRAAEEIAKADGHRSERELFLFNDKCRLLDNNSQTIGDLKAQVHTLVVETFRSNEDGVVREA